MRSFSQLPEFEALASEKRDPRKYRWLEYVGRKFVLDVVGSDRKEYELEITKGEKFGVKNFRGFTYILDESNLSVQFRLDITDARRIIANSKGYEGKISRYKVLPFIGGKDPKEKRKSRKTTEGHTVLTADSSVFSRLVHDPKKEILYVTFHNGAHWEYQLVSKKEATSLERAASQGSYFARKIKPLKPAMRIDESTASSVEASSGEYKGKQVTLEKPFRLPKGSKKKFGVYVKNDKGNIIQVKFGDPNMSIKRDDPARRKSFMARHQCSTKKDKTTPGYWSCKAWELSADWV